MSHTLTQGAISVTIYDTLVLAVKYATISLQHFSVYCDSQFALLYLFSKQINQLEADLQELGSLVEKAERTRVQELLKQEQKKVEKELSVKRQQKADQARREADPSTVSKPLYTVKITNYGMVTCTTLSVLLEAG